MLDSRVLGIGLDTRERSLGTRALHLELGYEDGGIATDALRIDHRSLVREEPEAREVLDVVRAEEDVAGQALAPDVVEQSLAPLLQLDGGYAGVDLGALRHHLLLGGHGSVHSRRSIRGYLSTQARLPSAARDSQAWQSSIARVLGCVPGVGTRGSGWVGPYDPSVIAFVLVAGVLGVFVACVLAGRYASWFGVVVPAAITVALGQGWEWDSEASLVIIASALVGGLGFAVGVSRRRKRLAVRG